VLLRWDRNLANQRISTSPDRHPDPRKFPYPADLGNTQHHPAGLIYSNPRSQPHLNYHRHVDHGAHFLHLHPDYTQSDSHPDTRAAERDEHLHPSESNLYAVSAHEYTAPTHRHREPDHNGYSRYQPITPEATACLI